MNQVQNQSEANTTNSPGGQLSDQNHNNRSMQMLENAQRTTDFLKSLAHTGRLMILCRLAEGPATVSELEEMLGMNQSSVSKQLARLRDDDMVDTQRHGRSIFYSLSNDKARQIVSTLYDMFCGPPSNNIKDRQ